MCLVSSPTKGPGNANVTLEMCAGSEDIYGSEYIYVSQGLNQDYIEQKLQASLQVISKSSELSEECAKYAIPAICLSTLPLCDTQTQKPRKVHAYIKLATQNV